MNKQRKVLITITYNEMGIIIDTKAEEVAQPNLQPICNQLATDTIDVNRNYEPSNCTWIPMSEQYKNKQSNCKNRPLPEPWEGER